MNYIFDQAVFDTFKIDSVDGRMTAIQQRIQPLFHHYAAEIVEQLANSQHAKQPNHVAKHLRRKVNPAKNTWVAVGGDQRGYKKYPHFQLGINPDYVFIVLAIIDKPTDEQAIARAFQAVVPQFEQLPKDMIVIPDHTQLPYIGLAKADFATLFERLEKVKKAEFMLGRLAKVGDTVLETQSSTSQWIQETVADVLPFFELALQQASHN